MLFVIMLGVLLLLAGAQLVLIWIRHQPRVRLSRLAAWSKFAWLTSMILMSIGLVFMGCLTAALTTIDQSSATNFWLDPFNSALVGAFLALLLTLLTALWRPLSAALVLAVAAVLTSVGIFLSAGVLSGPSPDQEFAAVFGVSKWVVLFSGPAMLVALLLWSSSSRRFLGNGDAGHTSTNGGRANGVGAGPGSQPVT